MVSMFCMPVADNLFPASEEEIKARHPDWQLVTCPICGCDCWESENARIVAGTGMKGACTNCVLRWNAKVNGGTESDEAT